MSVEQTHEKRETVSVGSGALVRPPHVPKLSGNEDEHAEDELVAFDIGAYDGEHGNTVPPAWACEPDERSKALREAWLTGYSAGRNNAPNA